MSKGVAPQYEGPTAHGFKPPGDMVPLDVYPPLSAPHVNSPYSPSAPSAGPQYPPQQQPVTMAPSSGPVMLNSVRVAPTCPSCHVIITTPHVKTEFLGKAHWWAACLCLCGCWPCCLIPYFMDSCHSEKHYCSNCKAYLGKVQN